MRRPRWKQWRSRQWANNAPPSSPERRGKQDSPRANVYAAYGPDYVTLFYPVKRPSRKRDK